MNKKLVLLLAVTMAIILLAGCGNSQDKKYIEGTYEVISLSDNGQFYDRNDLEMRYKDTSINFPDDFYIEFFTDGTFVSPMVNGEGGTYYITDGKIFAEDAEEKYTGTVDNDKITLVDVTGMEFTLVSVTKGVVT